MRLRGEMILGVRFPDYAGPLIRGGAGSIVVECLPIAGPIFREDGLEGGYMIATCDGCTAQSPQYKRRNAVQRWAHTHRCKQWGERDH